MEFKFVSRIKRGNNRGTGFASLPKSMASLFNLGDRVRIKLSEGIYFFSKIISYSHRVGFYVPGNVMVKNNLLNREIKIQIKKIDGFHAPISSEGRIYLPYDIVKKGKLHRNDIVSIKIIEDNKVVQQKYLKIYLYVRPERKQKEFICYLDPNLHGKNLIFQIEKLPTRLQNKKINLLVPQLFWGMPYAFINKNSAIVFKGNKTPAIVNTSFKLADFSFNNTLIVDIVLE